MHSKARLLEDEFSERGKIPGVRYLQSFLLFLCLFAAYLLRVSISVAIVAMTPDKNSTDFLLETHYHIPVFNWTQHAKSLILSAFFWGYLIMNLPAAMIGRRYNNQMLLAMSMMLTVALSLATPSLVVAFNWPVLVLIRFLQGLTQAFTMPMIHGISAKWAPPNERGRLVGFVLGGLQFGTVVTLVGSGILASTRSGWPSIYYFSGAFGIFWVILWLLLGSESPDTHRLITQSEKNYIKSSLTQTVSEKKNLITPWKEIFTSMPVWAVTISHAGHNCGFWLLLSEMPTFISAVLKFDIKSDGFVSALPYLAMWLCQFPVTYFADYMNKKNVTSLTFSRKFWNTLGMSGGALGLVVLGYMGENANAAICMYVFVVAIGCCTNVGFNINHLDLAPNYAGILMGFTNAVAALGGVMAPTVCGFIVHDQTSVDEWRIVFTLGAVILFFSSIFYIIFGSAEVQPWNEPKNESVGVRSFMQMKTDYGSSAGYTSSPSSFVKVTSKYTMFVRQ
ncbi:sialin [Acyrthosiphon pisum]|uniref:Major facilitator superfamily (MFS) profile domain-containing protein n=1 Tax=Acyrthosiphon pisum TaxID=7029 RepID=A0A8R1WZ16_ACYPI|nr:sialin [Acyrthosiphon pisum]XP_008180304.1 sialin [Acyrthosiphon pisum]|eukprot:XP_008180303.1 PREDICTED: sialin [Acyrthosiphon pisum]